MLTAAPSGSGPDTSTAVPGGLSKTSTGIVCTATPLRAKEVPNPLTGLDEEYYENRNPPSMYILASRDLNGALGEEYLLEES